MRLITFSTSDGDAYLFDSTHVLGFRIVRAPAHPATEMETRHYVAVFVSGVGQIVVDHYPTRAGAQAYLDQLARELRSARDEESAPLSVELSSTTSDCTGDHDRMLRHLVDEEGLVGVTYRLLRETTDPREFARIITEGAERMIVEHRPDPDPGPPKPTPAPAECRRCRGEGLIATSDDGEPWSEWENLPPGSDLAVKLGLVAPMYCPECEGSGVA